MIGFWVMGDWHEPGNVGKSPSYSFFVGWPLSRFGDRCDESRQVTDFQDSESVDREDHQPRRVRNFEVVREVDLAVAACREGRMLDDPLLPVVELLLAGDVDLRHIPEIRDVVVVSFASASQSETENRHVR